MYGYQLLILSNNFFITGHFKYDLQNNESLCDRDKKTYITELILVLYSTYILFSLTISNQVLLACYRRTRIRIGHFLNSSGHWEWRVFIKNTPKKTKTCYKSLSPSRTEKFFFYMRWNQKLISEVFCMDRIINVRMGLKQVSLLANTFQGTEETTEKSWVFQCTTFISLWD